MKTKNSLLFFLLTAVIFPLQAQFRVGVKAGVNVSDISMEMGGIEMDIYKPRMGYYAGLNAEYMFGNRFGLQSELRYGMVGATINPDKYMEGMDIPEGFSMEGHVSMHTLTLPLYAKLKFDLPSDMQFYFMGGGFASYAFDANQHMKQTLGSEYLKVKWSLFDPEIRILDETESNVYLQHRFNAGIALETGIEIKKQIIVGIGFQHVLTNMAAFGYLVNGRTVKPTTKMWTASLSVGYYL